MSSAHLLRLAIPLVRTHGFTRAALAESVLSLPASDSSLIHKEPLSDTAVSALFGEGDNARRLLIQAWLDEGLNHMRTIAGSRAISENPIKPSLREILAERLKYNEQVVHLLPEAFALLASPSLAFPPLDPAPALRHTTNVANEACHLSGEPSLQLSWYTRRASVTAAYTLAELHQLTSPATAASFLNTLLDQSSQIGNVFEEINIYTNYVMKSWGGLIRSSGAV